MIRLLAYKPEHESILVREVNGVKYVYRSNGNVTKGLSLDEPLEDCMAVFRLGRTLLSRGFKVVLGLYPPVPGIRSDSHS